MGQLKFEKELKQPLDMIPKMIIPSIGLWRFVFHIFKDS